jgi:hypothetical protein
MFNKLLENDLISKEQFKSLSPLKKPYGKKLGNFLIEGEFSTQKILETFLEENKQFLFELFDNFLNENSSHISLNELDNSGFWNRLKDKIDRSGGCEPDQRKIN